MFRGGWELAAAEAVGAGEGITPDGVFDRLASLVEQSLVLTETRGDGGTRYRLLVPVREYAEERLVQGGEAEGTRLRHAEYFLALAEVGEAELTGPGQVAWLARLDRENDNLWAALGWALGHGRAELGLRLVGVLWLFWRMRGHLTEGRRWAREALATGGGASAFARARVEHRGLAGVLPGRV